MTPGSARYFVLEVEVEDKERDGNGQIHSVEMVEDNWESGLGNEPPEDEELLEFANEHLPERLRAVEVKDFAH